MKVLFNTYPMAFHTPGGGEVQLLQYKEFLRHNDVDVRLLDLWNPNFLEADLVHFFSSMSGSVHFCAFVKKIGMPLVVSPNLWITEATKQNYPFEEIRTQFVLSDRVIGNSDMECDLLARVFNIPREHFSTVYNGVNETFFEPISPDFFRAHFGIEGPFVLNVANIEPRKNQLNLARAMKDFPGMKLVLIGYERDPDYALECFTEGGDQLRYLGPLPHDSPLLKSAYAACELFALPSTLETPGLAALEAAAFGAKVVITSEGCTREYFGQGAEYVSSDDVADISRGIASAMSKTANLLLAIRIRANFTWAQATAALADVYRELADDVVVRAPVSGFYPIESNSFRLYAWSRREASFACGSGVLNVSWHSLEGATVDIFLDGVLAERGVKVGSDWSRYSLHIPTVSGRGTRQVTLKVKPSAASLSNEPRELGVALGDIMLTAPPAGVDKLPPAVADVSFISQVTGFHPIEADSFRRYAWTRRQACFECETGTLAFDWHSLEGATVDIFLDDEPLQKNIEVSADWVRYWIDIAPVAGRSRRKVKFILRPVVTFPEGDPRELGVALGNVTLTGPLAVPSRDPA
jgi:glycosyltransferase involved in cell wall biosynthesis